MLNGWQREDLRLRAADRDEYIFSPTDESINETLGYLTFSSQFAVSTNLIAAYEQGFPRNDHVVGGGLHAFNRTTKKKFAGFAMFLVLYFFFYEI